MLLVGRHIKTLLGQARPRRSSCGAMLFKLGVHFLNMSKMCNKLKSSQVIACHKLQSRIMVLGAQGLQIRHLHSPELGGADFLSGQSDVRDTRRKKRTDYGAIHPASQGKHSEPSGSRSPVAGLNLVFEHRRGMLPSAA